MSYNIYQPYNLRYHDDGVLNIILVAMATVAKHKLRK
jgi:hypothetical protein